MTTTNLNFDNSKVRRQERLLEQTQAQELLRHGEYGVLSMVENSNGKAGAYGIPLNFV